jgi:DNA-binding transcriptional LysR family regulator
MLDLYKLHVFVLVVEEGSFSKAADRLLLTQSAISQHIRQLEAAYGTKLFQRGRRGVVPTEIGEKLYAYAQRIFQLVTEAEVAITDVKMLKSGQITIGATPGISVYLLPDLLQSFRQEFPRLTVSLQTSITAQIVEQLQGNRLDLGFIEGELRPEIRRRLEVIELLEVEQLVVVGRNCEWWGRDDITLPELQRCPFVMRQPKSQTRIWLDQILAVHNVHPQIIAEFDNVESIKRAVMAGRAMTVLPSYAVEQEVKLGQLHTISIQNNPLRRTLKLIWDKRTQLSPVARAFVRYLRQRFVATA